MRFFVCILMILFVSSPLLAIQVQESPPVRQEIDKMISDFQDGKYDEVNKQIDQQIAAGVQQANVWFLKGNCLSRLGKYREAVACFSKALEIDDAYVLALDERMNHYFFKLRDTDKAFADCNRLFQLGEKRHFMRAIVCQKMGIKKQAIADFSSVIDDRENKKEVARSHYYRGALLSKMSAWDLAVRDGLAAESVVPSSNGKALLAFNYFKLRNYDKSTEYYEKLMEIEPGVSWLLKLAECHAFKGQFEKAESKLAAARKLAQDNGSSDFESVDDSAAIVQKVKHGVLPLPYVQVDESMRREWKSAMAAKNRDKAMELMIQLGGQGDPECMFIIALFNDNEGLHENSLNLFSKVLVKSDFKKAETTYLRAKQLFSFKAYDLAKVEFERAITLGHRGLGTRVTLGILHLNADQYEKAIEDYKYEITVDPPNANPMSWAQLGVAYSCLGDLEQAKKNFETMIEKTQPGTPARLFGVNSLASLEKDRQLLNHLLAASEANEDNVIKHFSPKYASVLNSKALILSLSNISSKVDFRKLNWLDKKSREINNGVTRISFPLASGKQLVVHTDNDGALIDIAVNSGD